MNGHGWYPGDVAVTLDGTRVLVRACGEQYCTVVAANGTVTGMTLADLSWTGECLGSRPRSQIEWREAARAAL